MEKAKAFFLVCAGILMIAVAAELTVGTAEADEELIRGIVGMSAFHDTHNNKDLVFILTEAGELWRWNSSTGNWTEQPSWPGGVATQNSDWSQLKSSFGK